MAFARVIEGVGQDVNRIDGDRVFVRVGVRDGKINHVGANDIRVGAMTWVGATGQEVSFNTGAEAMAKSDETFAGCEDARRSALVLYKVFNGLTLEKALSITAADLIERMDRPPENERCVMTVAAAVRNALIDVQVTMLAEAIVDARALRDTG